VTKTNGEKGVEPGGGGNALASLATLSQGKNVTPESGNGRKALWRASKKNENRSLCWGAPKKLGPASTLE